MKLYELSSAYRALSDLCSEGEDFQQSLQDLGGELNEKIVNTAKVVRELEAHRDALKGESDRLATKARTTNNSIDRLKEYMLQNMVVVGLDSVKGDVMKIAVSKSPPACEVVSVEDVPLQLRTSVLKIPTMEVPGYMLHYKDGEDRVDRVAVIKMWKDGIDVPGTKITQGQHLRIT